MKWHKIPYHLKVFGVYTHSFSDGKIFYVGKGTEARSRNFKYRSNAHKKVVKKLGIDNVIIVFKKCSSETAAFKAEIKLIAKYRKLKHPLVNKANGGKGNAGNTLTTEHKKTISRTQKGKKLSNKTKIKVSAGLKRYFKNPKARRHSSNIQKQRMAKTSLRNKISNSLKGTTLPKKQKLKMREARLRWLSVKKNKDSLAKSMQKIWRRPSFRKKMAIAQKKSWADPRIRKIRLRAMLAGRACHRK